MKHFNDMGTQKKLKTDNDFYYYRINFQPSKYIWLPNSSSIQNIEAMGPMKHKTI